MTEARTEYGPDMLLEMKQKCHQPRTECVTVSIDWEDD